MKAAGARKQSGSHEKNLRRRGLSLSLPCYFTPAPGEVAVSCCSLAILSARGIFLFWVCISCVSLFAMRCYPQGFYHRYQLIIGKVRKGIGPA